MEFTLSCFIFQANYEAESLMVDMAETSFGYDIINAQSNGPRPFSQAETCYSSVVLKVSIFLIC